MTTAIEASKNLEHYVKEIYILILALGFILFVDKGQFAENLFDKGRFEFTGIIYFCALYFSLTYDWIAYHSLIKRFPYAVTAQSRSLARFYTDLVALLVKTFLIYLSTREVTFAHVVSVAGLFAIWHTSILAWYYFAQREQCDVGQLWKSHLLMVIIYGMFTVLLFFGAEYWPDFVAGESIKLWLLFLCGIIFAHAIYRTRYLYARLIT